MGLVFLPALAQETPNLVPQSTRFETQRDASGNDALFYVGEVFNQSSQAYENVQLMGDVLDSEAEVIGEVFGYLVTQCGFALLDYALQPQGMAHFALSVDLYEEGATPDRVDLFISGTPIEPEATASAETPAITRVSPQEVVNVTWRDNDTLLYGVGCEDRVFTSYQWHEYTLSTQTDTLLEAHPDSAFLTDRWIEASAMTRLSSGAGNLPALFDRSQIALSPYSARVVFQNDKNDLFIASRGDVPQRRLVHTILHQYTLKGILWTPQDNFLAYYFGAYGEPVRYFTANVYNGLISQVLTVNTPSNTVPSPQNDGERVVISGTFDGVTGYFFQSTRSPQRELLFEIDPESLAGNHYPAPAYVRVDNQTRYLYIIRPIDGVATLQCFHYEAKTLSTLTPLPLNLATDERAWSWLSPSGEYLAISAKGKHSGLWVVNLAELGCTP